MNGKLEIGPDGRVTGPVAITYNSPFPTGNGSWGSGAMMGVVMHTMVGNLQPTTVNLFNSPSAAVSAQLTASAQLVEVLSRFAGFPLQVTDSVDIKGYGTHVMGGAAWSGHTCPGPGPRAGQRYEIIARAEAIRAGQAAWMSDGNLSLNELAAQLKTEASSILQMTAIHDGAFAS